MFQLLQPILLLAGAGIVVPVIIHLWNIRKGKVRKVGSIQLLKAAAHSAARSLRLSDRWLLLLRCLLITMLALLLAKPVWLMKGKAPGWVLIEPSLKEKVYTAYRSTIDSLQAAGYECRSFDTSLSLFSIGKKKEQAAVDSFSSTLPYWTLLKRVDERSPAGPPVYVFSGRELRRFEGVRPQLATTLHWQSVGEERTMDTAVEQHRGLHDSLLTLRLHSDSSVAYFTQTTESVRRPFTSSFNTDSLHVWLYADDEADVIYLTAALEAIGQKTSLPLTVQRMASALLPQGKADWLFWLSEKPLPAGTQAAHVFLYKKGEAKESVSWLMPLRNDAEPIRFNRLITDSSDQKVTQPVWATGSGQIILSRTGTMPATYSFNSRLRAGWTDLVWHSDFAERMFALLTSDRTVTIKDLRSIDVEQMMPVAAAQKKPSAVNNKQQNNLRMTFWTVAFILFAIERAVALRRKKGDVHER